MADLPGWPWWKVISITGQSGAGTDYQVKFEIGDSAGGDFHLEGHCTNFPQDIRITDDDGITLLDHFVEDLTADPIVVHVEVKDDLGSNRDIRVYYGKNGETTASNGANTFPTLFDDFEDGNVTGWTIEGTQTFEAQTSVVKAGTYSGRQYNSSSHTEEAYKTFSNVDEMVFEFDFRVSSTSHQAIIAIETVGGNFLNFNLIQIQFVNDNNIKYYDGSFHTLQAYVINQWYHFKIVTHATADTFDIEIDDVNRGTGLGTRGDCTAGFLGFSIFGNAESHNSYLDNLFARKYNSPEPAFSSAGAEQSPTGVAPTGVFYGPFIGPFGGPT